MSKTLSIMGSYLTKTACIAVLIIIGAFASTVTFGSAWAEDETVRLQAYVDFSSDEALSPDELNQHRGGQLKPADVDRGNPEGHAVILWDEEPARPSEQQTTNQAYSSGSRSVTVSGAR